MAIIILNDIIEFDNERHSLLNKNTGDIINLSFTSSGLLNLLIEHKGDVVSRNEIFEQIFDLNGSHTTNNNLNQYISSVRRNIKSLGIEDEFIVTIPRTGFMISNNIKLNIIQSEREATPPPIMIQKKKQIMALTPIYGLIICIIFSGYICYYLYQDSMLKIDKSTIPVLLPERTEKFNGCDINIMSNNESLSSIQLENTLKNYFSNEKQKCSKDDGYYLFLNGGLEDRYQRFFLKCTGSLSDNPYCSGVYLHSSGEIK